VAATAVALELPDVKQKQEAFLTLSLSAAATKHTLAADNAASVAVAAESSLTAAAELDFHAQIIHVLPTSSSDDSQGTHAKSVPPRLALHGSATSAVIYLCHTPAKQHLTQYSCASRQQQ
jgi:hypothetical protein